MTGVRNSKHGLPFLLVAVAAVACGGGGRTGTGRTGTGGSLARDASVAGGAGSSGTHGAAGTSGDARSDGAIDLAGREAGGASDGMAAWDSGGNGGATGTGGADTGIRGPDGGGGAGDVGRTGAAEGGNSGEVGAADAPEADAAREAASGDTKDSVDAPEADAALDAAISDTTSEANTSGATGGTPGTGGLAATGGAPGTGGLAATGGAPGTGGLAATGGAEGLGGSGAIDAGEAEAASAGDACRVDGECQPTCGVDDRVTLQLEPLTGNGPFCDGRVFRTQDGTIVGVFTDNYIMVGDDSGVDGWESIDRGFLGFDLSSLSGMAITKANLRLSNIQGGGGVVIDRVDFGSGLDASDFDVSPLETIGTFNVTSLGYQSWDITEAVASSLSSGRLQLRLRAEGEGYGHEGQNMTILGDVEIGPPPQLVITGCPAQGSGVDAGDAPAPSASFKQSIVLYVASDVTPPGYQVRLALDADKVGPHFPWDQQCSGLRFTNPETSASLPYWTERCDGTDQTAVIWVKFDGQISGAGSPVDMYYAKGDTTNRSNGHDTFVFFDDFTGTTLGAAWSTYPGLGTISVDNGLDLACPSFCDWWGANDAPRIYRNVTGDAIFQTSLPNATTSTAHWTGIFVANDATISDASDTYIAEGANDDLCFERIGSPCAGYTRPSLAGADYQLKISKSGTSYTFAYSTDGQVWTDLAQNATRDSITNWGLMMKDFGSASLDSRFHFVFERAYSAHEPDPAWGIEVAAP
jgi:hypothetical protein